MAKVAAPPGSLPSDSLPYCGASMNARPVSKRKTPSELRGEQLKRRTTIGILLESDAPLENNNVGTSTSKPQSSKNTRYVDKRLDEVYPARKPTSRFTVLVGKSSSKENQVIQEKSGLKSSFPSHLTPKNRQELNSESVLVSEATDSVLRHCEKGNKSTFLSVHELSFGGDKLTKSGTVDVDKALKGLAAHEQSGSCSPQSSIGKSGDVKSAFSNFCSELHIPGMKAPLDFTLKTTMRIVSSSPLDWFHKLLMGDTFIGSTPFKFGISGNANSSLASNTSASSDSYNFRSWVYPQSSLPASVISVLSSSSGGAEIDFLGKRQLAWEESFRSLYYMLRNSGCNFFYVCTLQFIVIFTAHDGVGKVKRMCNAYISRSTRGLRSLLKEHDISFSMPLCSEVEQISREDLVELSEIEKHNLGQAKRFSSTPDVDNSPKSLLAFNGNYSVHGLYDFLLNYRSLLTTLSSMDVPVLCAPIPFLNAAISSPQVRCKEIRKVEALQSKGLFTKVGESVENSKSDTCYSIEVNDMYLPPWIICSMCSAMSSTGSSFEASFVTDPNSMGLNAALEAAVSQNFNTDETCGDSEGDAHPFTFGMSTAVVTPSLSSACLKGLKFSVGSYMASLSPV
ncbi:unnamed protein product [Amaranthus hypochondriacus]